MGIMLTLTFLLLTCGITLRTSVAFLANVNKLEGDCSGRGLNFVRDSKTTYHCKGEPRLYRCRDPSYIPSILQDVSFPPCVCFYAFSVQIELCPPGLAEALVGSVVATSAIVGGFIQDSGICPGSFFRKYQYTARTGMLFFSLDITSSPANIARPERCKYACLVSPSCNGATYDFKTGSCTAYLLAATSGSDLVTNKGTNYYEKINDCLSTTTTVVTTTEVVPSVTSGAVLVNKHRYNGTLQAGTLSESECYTKCQTDATCFAADFNKRMSPQECWFHFSAACSLIMTAVDNCCNHFVKTVCP